MVVAMVQDDDSGIEPVEASDIVQIASSNKNYLALLVNRIEVEMACLKEGDCLP